MITWGGAGHRTISKPFTPNPPSSARGESPDGGGDGGVEV